MDHSGKEKLTELEREQKYVFHGAGARIDEFEPRQAYNFIHGEKIPDGEPAVFASPFADYAIFMALINKENFPDGYYSGVSFGKGKLTFRATRETVKCLRSGMSGYVYVFDRHDFVEQRESEWVNHKKIKPICVIPISYSDFIPPIEEIPSDFIDQKAKSGK